MAGHHHVDDGQVVVVFAQGGERFVGVGGGLAVGGRAT